MTSIIFGKFRSSNQNYNNYIHNAKGDFHYNTLEVGPSEPKWIFLFLLENWVE